MRRRGFVSGAGTLAWAWSLAVRAQAPGLPVLGFLSGGSRDTSVDRVEAFREGLARVGVVDGRQVSITYRWADGDYDRLAAMADELVRQPVALLVAVGGPRAVLAAKAATTTIPIVFTIGGDPVRLGIVASLSRPGANLTGVSFLTADLMPKRFELLRELVPRAKLVALLVNPNTPSADEQIRGTQAAARAAGVRLHVARAGTEAGIDAEFAVLMRQRPDALLIGTDAFFNNQRAQLVALAARYALPAIYEGANAVEAGGLLSYGPDIAEAYRQVGGYAARVLGGVKPSDLPVLQPTKFELAVNQRTARALGLKIPQSMLLRADQVVS